MAYVARGKYYDDFQPGDTFESPSRTVTETDIVLFAGLSGDYNALHTDEEFARTTRFGRRVAHGMLVLSIATGLSNQTGVFEQTVLAFSALTARFRGPVVAGDTLHLVFKVQETRVSTKPERGTHVFLIHAVNQTGDVVLETEWTVMMKRRPQPGAAEVTTAGDA